MATSEPLVPKGREQGARQETEAMMDLAGISKTVPAGGRQQQMVETMARAGTAPEAAIRPARPDFDPLLEASPAQFPFLEQRGGAGGIQPTQPQTMVEVFAGIAQKANNGAAQAIAARLAEKAGR